MPSSQSTKPRAPASTTPAFCNTGICRGVSASAWRARCNARVKPVRGSSLLAWPAASSSASANAEMTLRMVPSTGLASALRALSAPRRTAAASARASSTGALRACSARPTRNCAMIAPELPRAPSMASLPMRASSSPMCRLRRLSAPCSTLPRVEARLLPVSPSGTGNTLMRLSSSRAAMTRRVPAIIARRRAAAVTAGAGVDWAASMRRSLRDPRHGACCDAPCNLFRSGCIHAIVRVGIMPPGHARPPLW